VERYRRKFGVPLPSHEECLKDPVYSAWWADRERKSVAGYRRETDRKRARLRRELEYRRLKILGSGMETAKGRTCKACGNSFPPTRMFFHHFEQREPDGKTSGYLSKICLACPRKWRKKAAEKRRED
jgi:hypothetical protein